MKWGGEMKRFQIAWLLALAFLLASAPTLLSEKSAIVKITGDEADDHFGWNVSSAGDVNDDGYEDIIVGAPGYGNDKGRAYIFFGSPYFNGDLSAIEANVTINGSAQGDKFGWDVSSAGDVNGDLISDVIVGAPGNDSNTGRAYIFFGNDPMPKFINATEADVILSGKSEGDEFGLSVSSAGDVNNDDLNDVIVGAPGNDSNTGAAYIFLGNAIMIDEHSNLFSGFNIGDMFGFSVSTVGDVNNDDYDDVIVGAPGADRAYIFYGGEPMNSWVQTSDADFNSADEKVHVKMLGDEVRLDTFFNTKAMMAYYNGSSGFEHIPKNRTWDQSIWTPETDANSQGLDHNYWFVIESGTVRKNEKILAVSNSTGGINVQVSNGISWSPILNLSGALYDANYRGFDVAYETYSGEAMIAYINNKNNSQVPEYRIWNGTEWSVNQSALPASSTEIYWVVLASNPKSDEILMVTLDSSSYIYAQVWNGSTWGNPQEIETNAAQTDYQCFDAVYESQSGYGFIAWADNSFNLWYRRWRGLEDTWSEPEVHWNTSLDAVRFLKLASNANTNYILGAQLNSLNQINATVWNGIQWGITKTVSTSSTVNNYRCFDVTWESTSDREGIVVYNNGSQKPKYRNVTDTLIDTLESEAFDPNPGIGQPNWITLESDPQSDDIMMMYMVNDGGMAVDDIGVELWNGSGWEKDQNVVITSEQQYQRFDLAYTDTSGYFTSAPHDAIINSSWGRIHWAADLPIGTLVKLRTKTSTDNKTWSNWSEWYEDGDRITSPNGRWIQYQAWLETTDVTLSPTLKEVMIELNRPDVTINGTIGDLFGWSVSALGHLNNDDYDDFIIGAPRSNFDQGSSYVFFGEEWASGTYLNAASHSQIIFTGENIGDMFGYSVSSAGNFSRDIRLDIVIGAPYANGNGTVYVFYGKENMSPTINAVDANYTAIGENATDNFGWSVSFTSIMGSPGNDYHRIIVTAPYFNNGPMADAGRVYLFEPAFQPDLHDDLASVHYYADPPDDKQVRLQGMRFGEMKSFELTLTNDGDITDSFNISWDWPFGQHSLGWEAWAWDLTNGVNITSDLLGGYITPTLGEGEGIALAVNISAPIGADYGDISSIILNATSTNNTLKRDAFRLKYQIWTVDEYYITEAFGGPEMADQAISVGSVKAGYASAFNNTGGYIGLLNCTWNVTTDTGGSEAETSDGNGTDEEFIAGTKTGKVRWNAINNSLGGGDSVIFTIPPGPVDTIECSQWPSQTYPVGTQGHPFEVIGYDQYGNENWTFVAQWIHPGGDIIEGGDPYNVTYDAGTLAGSFYVNVSVDGVYNLTEIVLQPEPLNDFYLEVSSTSPIAGQSTTITVTAVDSYNNVNTTYSKDVDISVNGATKSSMIVYSDSFINDNEDGTATLQVGAWQNGVASFMVNYNLTGEAVNFRIDDLAGTSNTTGDITWLPDEIDRISLIPFNPAWDVDLSPGPHTFTAEGYDQYDNINTQWTPVWEATGGTISGTGYTATYTAEGEPGEFYVKVRAQEDSNVYILTVVTFERHRPTITVPVPHQQKPEDSEPWEFNLHDNASDPEDDPDDLKWYITGEEAYDSIFYVTGEGNSTLTFHTVEDGWGNCEVMLWVHDTDGNRDGQVLWVNITPDNDAPFFDSKTPTYFVVHYDNPEFPEDDPQPYDFSMFLHDIDNDPSELVLQTSEPSSSNPNGWIEVAGKELTYHYPYSRLEDDDISVILTLSDGELSSEQVILLRISSNWQPQKLKDLEDVYMNENSTLHDHFDLDDYFYDKDGDVIYFYIIDQDAFVNVTIDHEDNTVDFITRPLSSNQIHMEYVTFVAEDPSGAWLSTTINVTVFPINDPPTIQPLPKYFIVHYGKNWTFDLSPYVSDPDNELSDLLISIEQSEYLENNYVTIDGMVLTFNFPLTFVTDYVTLNVEYIVPITIKVTDGIATASQRRDVKVTVNNPPTLDEEIPDIQFYEDTNFTTEWTLNDYFSDIDTADILYYVNPIKDIRLNISINNDSSSSDYGRITFTPQDNWFGVVKITIRALDNRGAFKEDTFLVRVLPVNDPPIIKPIPTQRVGEGFSWVLDLRNHISDVDNLFQELEISVTSYYGANVHVVGGFILFEYSEGIYNDTITLTIFDGADSTQSTFYVELSKPTEQDVSLFASLERICFFPWSLFILIPLVLLALFYTRRRTAAAKAKKESVLEDAFLVYENGCLIAHHTRRLKPDYDHHIMTSMLTAIQSFVKDSFKDESDWDLKNISFGESQIVIERGKNFFLAAVYKGQFQEEFSEKMRKVIGDVEEKYGEELVAWNGDLDTLRGTKDLMEPLFLSPEEIEELRNNNKDNDITSTD